MSDRVPTVKEIRSVLVTASILARYNTSGEQMALADQCARLRALYCTTHTGGLRSYITAMLGRQLADAPTQRFRLFEAYDRRRALPAPPHCAGQKLADYLSQSYNHLSLPVVVEVVEDGSLYFL